MKIPYIVMLAIGLAGAFSLGQAQVIISEVCADNTRYEDEDTDTPDWFELHNVGDAAVNLDGWQLDVSEDSSQPWIIRHLVLQPGEVRLFFASGKDRPGSGNTIETYRPHTAFSLSNDGEELRLREPGPDSTSTHAITYPELGKNVGYGVKDDVEGYLFPVTPNERNTAAPSPNTLAPDVEFSHSGGIIKGPLELLLEVPGHPEAVIQYAFDGAEPSLFTPTYSGQPVVIDRTTTILARALLPDHLPSRLQGIGFILLDGDLNEFSETGETFSSNLPVIVIDTLGQNVDNSRAFKQTTISVTRPGEESGRTVLGEPAEYAGPAGVHLRGESSAGFGQKSYSLELRDEDEDDHDASLLGMPADSDWALYGPWSEKSLMRNKLTFDWMRELRGDDGTSMRSEFCELFLNQRGTETLGYDSYQGVYLLMEKIKRGQDRVPIENLNEYTVDPDMITGGYIIRKDKVDGGKDSWSTGTYNIPLQSFDPDRFNLEQLAYVKAYMNHFESALRGDDFTHPTKGYQKYRCRNFHRCTMVCGVYQAGGRLRFQHLLAQAAQRPSAGRSPLGFQHLAGERRLRHRRPLQGLALRQSGWSRANLGTRGFTTIPNTTWRTGIATGKCATACSPTMRSTPSSTPTWSPCWTATRKTWATGNRKACRIPSRAISANSLTWAIASGPTPRRDPN